MPLDSTAGSHLETQLRREIRGEVLFDAFSRGRYSTDASIYQIEPLGVVIPRDRADAAAAIAIAREEGVPVLPRGAGTSQCGQTVARALVIDCSRHMDQVVSVDVEARRARVEPGVVLDRLNRRLRQHKLFFPVDPSTASRATLGGMTANNSCGSRSLRYGNMVHNVRGVEALLADGTSAWFGAVADNFDDNAMPERYRDLVRRMRALHRREADEIARRFPQVLRRVGGYNINSIDGDGSRGGHNMARLLVGSEGTLAFFNEIELELQPIPAHRVLGICHFPSFYSAMEATRKIVELGPSAVELVDRTMIDLSRDIPMFRAVVDRFVQGAPAALLLTEFAGDDPAENLRRLKALHELMGDLGFPGGVVDAIDPAFQAAVLEVRAQGLNIMMSMKGDGKPISFLEDCAVRLEDLADYTDRLTHIFEKHGTYGTWYAHASVGCLHVRPVLNLKQELEVKKMRAIAEEAFAMVREYKGSHSGEHGDGLVRSEFHEAMFGGRLVRAFEEVKDAFDPHGLFNPGKIVRPPKMDDRSLFRFKPDYRPLPIATALDWSEWGGFAAAAEMCNNNGACRVRDPGVMCPSFRATGDERHLTRGRANTLRLALSGQLGRRGAGLAGYARDDGSLHLVQGLQARMPDRCRHGADEDRISAPLSPPSQALAARPADRLSAALRTPCRALCAVAQSAQPGFVFGPARRALVRAQRRAPVAAMVLAALRRRTDADRRRAGSRPPCRHLQPLVRAGKRPRRRTRAGPRRLPRRQPRPGARSAVVLRAHVFVGRSR